MKRYIFFICVMYILSLLTGCGAPKPVETDIYDRSIIEENPSAKVVRVGYFDDGKFMSGAAEDEIKQGYGYDYLQMIANHTGWQYQYVYGSWSQLYEKLLRGEIDVMPDVSYTSARTAIIDFPAEPMGHEVYYIACRTENTEINWNDLSSFNGKKIGVEKNSIQVKYLEDWIAKNGIDCTVVQMSSGKQSKLAALEAGAIDALVMTHFKGKINGVSNVVVLGKADYYLAVAKGRNDLLEEINVAQRKIADAHPVFMTKLEYQHFPDAMVDQRLTAEEKEWLAHREAIRIGYLKNNLPFCGTDSATGEPIGLMPIVMNSMCENLQIDKNLIKYIPFDNGEAMKQSFAQGDLDAVFGIYKNLGWAEKNYVAQTDDIYKVNISMLLGAGVNREQISKVAVALDRPYPAYINLLGLDECELIYYKDFDDAIDAVRNGNADCTFINEYGARKYLRSGNLYNDLENVDGIYNAGVCFSIRRDEEQLTSIFRRGISMLDDREVNKWVGDSAYEYMQYGFKDFVREYWWLSIIFAVIAFLIFVIFVILVKSRKRIAKINSILRNQKDMLQVANSNLIDANENQIVANEELTAKNSEINELFDRQQSYIDIIEQNHEALKSANWVVEFDPLGEIDGISWSDGMRHILGYNDTNDFPDNLDILLEIIHPEDLPVGSKFVNEIKSSRSQTSNIIDMELRLKKKDSDYVWFRVYARMSRRSDGTPLRLYGVFQDIEEYKLLIEQAEDALSRAQQASNAKSIFLSNMSHDMRTPMNGIMGYTALALDNFDKPSKVKDYLKKIRMVSKHLLSLINDVLDMSRIESGRIELDPQPTNLVALVDELKSILQSDIEMNNLKFQIDTDSLYNETVVCDRLRLKQILLNLLSNAVKFTKDGNVSLKLVEIADDKKNSKLSKYEFHVEDNGIGIDSEFISKLFTPFERARNTTVSGIQGTGLGMSITKSLVEMMDGDIQVTSEVGKGTHFVVTLEFVTCSHQLLNNRVEHLDNYDFSGKRVLLVDDNSINQEIARALLENVHMEVDVVGDGTEAVERIKDEAHKYDVVLMDIQMPIMDGYEATKTIRSMNSEYAKTVPIVAMTANVFAEDKARALNAGMNSHVAKPIETRELYSTLHFMMSQDKA